MNRPSIDRAGLLRALASAKTSLFRLETHPVFFDLDEEAALRALSEGREPDFSYHEAWLGLVQDRRAAGVEMRRLRIHQMPLTAYQRVEIFHAYPRSAQAGEEIRLLELPENAEPMRRDFWLVDAPVDLQAGGPDDPDEPIAGVRGLWLVYGPDAAFLRAEEARPVEIGWMCRIRRECWPSAVPLAEASPLLR